MSDLRNFLDQNTLTAATITPQDREALAPFVQHYAGGLVVALRDLEGDRYVKLHDSWGDDGQIVVHAYPDDDVRVSEDEDEIRYFDTGWQAVAHFLAYV